MTNKVCLFLLSGLLLFNAYADDTSTVTQTNTSPQESALRQVEESLLDTQNRLKEMHEKGLIPTLGGAITGEPRFTSPLSLKPEEVNQILESPMAKRFLALMNHPDFFPSFTKLKMHKDWSPLVVTQVVFLVFMIIARGWQQAAQKSWMGRLWVSLYTAAIYWIGGLYVIPVYFLGEPYKKILIAIWTTFS